MDEYYRKKLLNKILEEKASQYNILKEMLKDLKMSKNDRNLQVIDVHSWLILINDREYSNVQTDTLEEHKVRSTWTGDLADPFEFLVTCSGRPICFKCFYSEEEILKHHEKVVFLIEQKIFCRQHSC
mgnify:CR=1 FL=1